MKCAGQIWSETKIQITLSRSIKSFNLNSGSRNVHWEWGKLVAKSRSYQMINEVASFVIILHTTVTHFSLCCLHCTLAAIFFLHRICTLAGPGCNKEGNHWRRLELPGFWLADVTYPGLWLVSSDQIRGWSSLEVMPRMRRDLLQTRASCSHCAPVTGG